MTQALTVAVNDRIARITLNRPEVRNAFNDEVIPRSRGLRVGRCEGRRARRGAGRRTARPSAPAPT
jgi:hypothetical protein